VPLEPSKSGGRDPRGLEGKEGVPRQFTNKSWDRRGRVERGDESETEEETWGGETRKVAH